MNLFSSKTNALALLCIACIVLGFFLGGLFKVLDNFMVKLVLFSSFGVLVMVSIGCGLKNETKKNRPEDELQDDSQ